MITTTTKNKRKKRLWLIPLGAVLIAVLFCAVLIYRALKVRQTAADAKTEQAAQSPEDAYDESGYESTGTVVWNGKTYTYNDHLSNFLFLGIDKREPVETDTGHADAGQSDALFLVSWDRVTGSMTVISIPRDSMVDMEVFAYTGESLGKNRNHICLAYAYGDGSYESLSLAEQAVSNLFYGLPVESSCAVNLDALPVLADSVGGLTVTVPNDSLEEAYPEFQEGTAVELDKDNTETFVRYRDVDKSQSAITRLERQQAFLEAFKEKAVERFSENREYITELYESLEPYMVSTVGKDQLAKLMESLARNTSPGTWTVPGEGIQGEKYDEYIVDENALYARIIETFYKEAE